MVSQQCYDRISTEDDLTFIASAALTQQVHNRLTLYIQIASVQCTRYIQ